MSALLTMAFGCDRPQESDAPPPVLPSPEITIQVAAKASEPGWFEDATERLGLDFVHDCGPTRTYYMPEIMGAGCGLLDYDKDGDLDIYLINGGYPPEVPPPAALPTNRLFRQESDGRFVDVTEESGLGDTGYGMGVAVADYDNDGFVDVYITNYGANALYRNRGDSTFENVTAQTGTGDEAWGTSAAFFDYDADGWLDLFVVNYLQLDTSLKCYDATGRRDYCGPERFPGAPDVLYHNNGDGTFTIANAESGIGAVGRRGLGIVCADLTGDGVVDIYIANDNQPNQLWVNQGDGRFVDEAIIMGVAFNQAGQTEASMGLICDDLDGDADPDLFLTHLRGESNTLYRNDGHGAFEDISSIAGIIGPSMRFTGFGVAALDIEHDGDLDLVAVNGHVFRGRSDPAATLGSFWNDYAQTGLVMRNTGSGVFDDASSLAGLVGSEPQVGRGLAVGDLDGDGDLDLVNTNCNGRVRVLVNHASRRGHWLIVRALVGSPGRDAIGAVVTVRAGSRTWVRQVSPAFSYLSSSDPRVHFGLGEASAVDEIAITWPGGEIEAFPGGSVDQVMELSRGGGLALGTPP